MKATGTFFLILFATLEALYASPVDDAIKLAADKGISSARQWNKLLHIERNFAGLRGSQIKDADFFLGKSTGDNEVDATLKGFAAPLANYEKLIDPPIRQNAFPPGTKLHDHSQHPICRFPARLKYLKTVLSEASSYWGSLPRPECIYQKIFLETVDPKSYSFVFSSYYSDSPGSAFGHTFFRINRNSNTGQRQELLDYGVGFAANVTTENQILYAVMGLLGGFNGTWTNLPYYYKVREYNDFESRDLWSYDLTLTDDEVEMLTLHLWEVGPHNYSYYFFTQNCAYHMLTLLEAAAPRLRLTDHVPFYYVIPADSMKSLFYENGLVSSVSFRPSLRKNFLGRAQILNESSLAALKKYIDTGDFSNSLSLRDEALFLDAALDFVDLSAPQAGEKKNLLLKKRAENSFVSPSLEIKMESEQDPAKSHGSSRWGLSLQQRHSNNFGYFDYRFALHDLLDPVAGLPTNSQLEFFHFNFEIMPGEMRLRDWNLFKVFNLNPKNFFENKLSWGLEIGSVDRPDYCGANEGLCHLSGLTAKVGKSVGADNERLVFWALGTATLRAGDRLLRSADYVAPGIEFGVLYRPFDRTNLSMTAGKEFPAGRPEYKNVSLELRHSPAKSFAFGVKLEEYSGTFQIFQYY